ncbi:MAG: hypothetical protein HKN62_13065 [Phycisphaerales bacterium]|nr:hypothetical protein [Phycisphaerales bacterium]
MKLSLLREAVTIVTLMTGIATTAACPVPVVDVFLIEGDDAPGTKTLFENFDRPSLSELGVVAFTADTDDATDADDVVYRGFELVAREGEPAPDAPGASFAAFEFFETGRQINAAGAVVFIATLRDVPAAANRAVYRDGDLIAREGDDAFGTEDRIYEDFGFAGVTDDGTVGFLADLDGNVDFDSAITLGGDILYREGDPVPLPGIPGVWTGNFDELQFNGRGDLIFEGDTQLPSASDKLLLVRRETGGIIEEVLAAQEGQTVETRTGTDTLELILQAALAEDGTWAFRGNLADAPSTADAIILSERGFMTQQGSDVPELPGVVTGNFNGVDVNRHGDVVYLADLEGATPPGVEEGLFVNGCLVITDGVEVAGLPEDTTLSDIGFEDLFINDDGLVVFAASYGGALAGDGLFTFQWPGTSCPADLDRSGEVGFTDLLAVLSVWGPCPPPCPQDLDESGDVGFTDLLTVLSAWGPCR